MKPDGPESAARHAATGAVKAPTAKRPPATADRHFHGIESRLAAAEVTSTSFLAIRKSSRCLHPPRPVGSTRMDGLVPTLLPLRDRGVNPCRSTITPECLGATGWIASRREGDERTAGRWPALRLMRPSIPKLRTRVGRPYLTKSLDMGDPRPGHSERKVELHIADVLQNIDGLPLEPGLSNSNLLST